MSSVDEIQRQAFELHRGGRLAEAEQLYRQILTSQPGHAPTLHLLGVLAVQNYRVQEGIGYFQQAVAADPGQAGYHHGLGEAYRELGQLEAAKDCFRLALERNRDFAMSHFGLGLIHAAQGELAAALSAFGEVLRIAPDMAEAHHELGTIYHRQGRLDKTVEHFRRVLFLRGESAEAHVNLGSVLQETGQTDEAIELLQIATRLRPDLMAAHYNLGNALRSARRPHAAASSYRAAIRLDPSFAQAHNNLGTILQSMGENDAARESFSEAIRLDPNSGEAHHNLGALLLQSGDVAGAREHLARAIELDPGYAPSHFNLGGAHLKLREWDAARRAYREALRLRPNYAEPHCSLGLLCMAMGEYDEARAHLDAALAMQSDIAEAHCDRGMLLLGGGDYEAGWPEFAWFPRCASYVGKNFIQPVWNGAPLEGRTLLVVCDQSFGDTLQFVRYLPGLGAEAHGRVICAAQRALLPLLAESGFEDVVALDDVVPFNVHTSIMMLPALHYARRKSIDAPVPYLRASAALVERWRERLADVDRFKVGICWQGNKNYPWDEVRSVPLAQFAPLAEVAGVRWIALQYGHGREQLAEWGEKLGIVDLGDDVDRETGAFMDTAAIVKNLDLVITSDTSTAHLAGALGAKVWLALSRAPEFRWMREGETCPWYPSMRLFRQTTLHEWPPVFARIASELRALVSSGATK